MSWEYSITMSFIGSALVIAYLGSCIKEDEENIRWTKFLPIGLRTLLYFVSFGMLIFSLGVQTPILMENNIHVEESAANSTLLLQASVIGGVSVLTKVFYTLIVIISIFVLVLIIERILLKRRGGGDYDKY